MQQVLFYVFLAIFALTALLTLAGLVRLGPGGLMVVQIQEEYLRKLFTALVLELVGVVIGWAVLVTHSLEGSVADLRETAARFEMSADERTAETHVVINEPSGIILADLKAYEDNRGPFGLAVDDEEDALYVVEAIDDTLRLYRTLRFNASRPKDLEAITRSASHYFAIASHRQLGDDGTKTRMLLRFAIDPRLWVNADYEVAAEPRDLSRGLGDFLALHRVTVNSGAWATKANPSDAWHPWALEIEGIATRGSDLLIGLKWPLDAEGRALMLAYNWDRDEFVGLERLDLNKKGISDLAFDAGTGLLAVAANPPEKEREDNADDERRYLGESAVYVYRWPLGAKGPDALSKVRALARGRARLEGIAFAGEELWLAYDGASHALVRRPIGDLEVER